VSFFFSSGGGSAFSADRAASLSKSTSRSQILGRRYQPFNNPFFDQASTYTPPTVKSLFGFCRFYYLTHGIINAIITKASEYPVTDIILQHGAKGVTTRWEELILGILNYRVFQFEANLDYFVYGNTFASAALPFRKKIICKHCSAEHDAVTSRPQWRYTNHRFWLTCPKCGQIDYAKSRDDYYPKYSEIGMIRWNPENVHIFYNEATGRMDYGLDISPHFRSQVMMGRKDLVATTPEIFLQAVKSKRSLVFDRKEVFHMRRPSLSSANRGWGIPLMMPIMKDAFYMQVMKKAQESVLLTHLVPQIFLFPQPATAGADPFSTVDLQNWRDHIRREIARQRMDPSYYGILPFPLGHQVIGENGRSLLLMPEIRQVAEMIIVGMGFPVDLVYGQGTYAGSSVSMRMLENFFLSNVHSHMRMLNWVLKRLGSWLNWPVPTARFKQFRMADDLQRQAFMFQLNQAGKVSDSTLLSYGDLKVEDETQLMLAESGLQEEAVKRTARLQAEIQGEAILTQAKYQARAEAALAEAQARAQVQQDDPFQQAQQSPTGGPSGMSLDAAAAALAEQLRTMPDDQREAYMSQIQTQSPEMMQLVRQNMMTAQQAQAEQQQEPAPSVQGAPAVDARPLPEQLPPRRSSLN
jgi:hypothetical protein